MAGPEFFQTVMGKRFYESTAPRIASALERIAEALEKNLEPEVTADPLAAMNGLLTKGVSPEVLLERVLMDTEPTPEVVEALQAIINGISDETVS